MSKTRNFGVDENEQKDGIAGAETPAEVVGVTTAESPEKETAAAQAESAAPPVLVYIGPSIFHTALISGRAFITHGKKMDDIIPEELRKYPLARMMFAAPSELAEIQKKIHDPGTAVGNAYKRLSGN